MCYIKQVIFRFSAKHFSKRRNFCFFPIFRQTRRRLSDDLESRVNALWVVSRQSSNLVRTHTCSRPAIESKRRLEY